MSQESSVTTTPSNVPWSLTAYNYGSHTLRKTWGYHQLRINGAPIPLLMEAYGHSTQKQTLDYLCIDADEIRELYALEL